MILVSFVSACSSPQLSLSDWLCSGAGHAYIGISAPCSSQPAALKPSTVKSR